MLDIIIVDGLIVDGTGRKAFAGGVGIKDGRIVAVGNILEDGKRYISARGKVVAPGFIDIHSHSDYHLLINRDADSKVRQGVTTEVGGNCGYSAAPVSREVAEERKKTFPESFHIVDFSWKSVQEYFEILEEEGISVNFGMLCGYNTARASVMGGRSGSPGRREFSSILSLCEVALTQGAMGFSLGLAYAPGCFSSKAEILEVGKMARDMGVLFSAHIRNESNRLLESLEEFLEIGRVTGANLEISHLKALGRKNWGKLDEAFLRIETIRKDGCSVTADCYPYTAANTSLVSLLPAWVLQGTPSEIRARLRSPRMFKRIVNELHDLHPEPNFWREVVISQTLKKTNRKWEGRSVLSAAGKSDPAVFVVDLLRKDRMATAIQVFSMSEENVIRILRKPWVMVGSDSAVSSAKGPLRWGLPHPRAFGTFPRILRDYVRARKVFSLEEAIFKMSGFPAQKLGLKDRGVIKKGAWADIVIFSPDGISDRATYTNPYQYPRGIDYVLVNGRVTVERGRHTGVRSGKVIKRK